MGDKKFVCLDIGGSKVLGAVMDNNCKIIYKIKKRTKAERGAEKIEETIVKTVIDVINESGISRNDIECIATGLPGVTNEDTGELLSTPNLPFKNYNIRGIIQERFGVPLYLGNDVNLGVLGEWKYGAGKGKKNVVGIFVGTGVGGGIIMNNQLYTGSTHTAAEFGHMIVNTEGPYCNCGQRGCLEAYAGKLSMTKYVKVQIDRGRKTMLRDWVLDSGSVLKSKFIKKAYEQKDEVAIEIVEMAIHYLSAGIGSLINIFNPDMVIFGGGFIGAMGEYIMPRIVKQVKAFSMPDIYKDTVITQSALGDDSVLYGAYALIEDLHLCAK